MQIEGRSYRSKGLEIDADIRVGQQWQTTLSYAYVSAHTTIGSQAGIQADNVPKHNLSLWNTYRFGGNLSRYRLGLGAHGESKRTDAGFIMDGYMEFDAGIYYSHDTFDVSLVIRNLADKNRVESGGTWLTVGPNQPRSLNFKFRYRF